jgi:SAM-dependent methyltransferase
MPTTREAGTDAFFEPLDDLRSRPETELYLGVIRANEADETARLRIEAAHRHAGEFGVATACGWGRHLPAEVPELLAAHVRLSRAVAGGPATSSYVFGWDGVDRIPKEDWVTEPVDEFGLQYDTVENHGWYRNLDPTVDELAQDLRDGQVLIDYSGGTGILLDRLFLRIFDRQIGVVIVDSSAKFLRVALERFEQDERVAFRRLQFLREEGRLQYLDEAIDPALVERGVDAIVSTNAIHLYHDLENTVRSWARVLRPGGRVYVNSGNIRNPRARENEWILDETVYVVHEVATGLARTDPRYEQYRGAVSDPDYIARHLDFRDRVFVPPRPLEYYVNALRAAGLEIENVAEQTIEADVQEWYEFLSAYHDAVLGWMGGSKKVDGVEPSREAVRDRLQAIRTSLGVIFGGRSSFKCCWTYLTARTER